MIWKGFWHGDRWLYGHCPAPFSSDHLPARVCRPPRRYRSDHGDIVRCLLQNTVIGADTARACVDKVFTYGTPHNGVDLRGLNVPRLFNRWEPKNFNRRFMRGYLDLPDKADRVDSLNGRFPPERFFCLVGTNHRDYSLARLAVGPMSDGLVTINNATVQGAPRAFVYRSHSGPFGLVNSEEGYQNLVRFLFGDIRLTVSMEVMALPLPPTVAKAKHDGDKVRVSYYFDCSVMLRGVFDSLLTERRTETASSIFRRYDELFKPEATGDTLVSGFTYGLPPLPVPVLNWLRMLLLAISILMIATAMSLPRRRG